MSELVPLPPPPFEYTLLAAEDVKWLKEKVGVVRLLARQTALNLLYLGKHLTEVKERIGSRAFNQWVNTEFAYKRSHANRMVAVWAYFADLEDKKQLVERFDPSALQVLVERSTPEEARVLAVNQAEQGERVTARGAREMIACLKVKADPVAYAKRRQVLNRTFKDDRPKAEDRTLSYLAWEAFKSLLEGGRIIQFERVEDNGGVDDTQANPWLVTIYPCDDGKAMRKEMSADGIEALVMRAAGRERQVMCEACKVFLGEFTGFSRKEGNKSGRANNCRACEVTRVKVAKKRKRDSSFQQTTTPSLFPVDAAATPVGEPAAPNP